MDGTSNSDIADKLSQRTPRVTGHYCTSEDILAEPGSWCAYGRLPLEQIATVQSAWCPGLPGKGCSGGLVLVCDINESRATLMSLGGVPRFVSVHVLCWRHVLVDLTRQIVTTEIALYASWVPSFTQLMAVR